jgi:hypothetical protein
MNKDGRKEQRTDRRERWIGRRARPNGLKLRLHSLDSDPIKKKKEKKKRKKLKGKETLAGCHEDMTLRVFGGCDALFHVRQKVRQKLSHLTR